MIPRIHSSCWGGPVPWSNESQAEAKLSIISPLKSHMCNDKRCARLGLWLTASTSSSHLQAQTRTFCVRLLNAEAYLVAAVAKISQRLIPDMLQHKLLGCRKQNTVDSYTIERLFYCTGSDLF